MRGSRVCPCDVNHQPHTTPDGLSPKKFFSVISPSEDLAAALSINTECVDGTYAVCNDTDGKPRARVGVKLYQSWLLWL